MKAPQKLQVLSLIIFWPVSDQDRSTALFFLMPVFSKSLFTLVRSHFMSFSLLTAWHMRIFLLVNNLFSSSWELITFVWSL